MSSVKVYIEYCNLCGYRKQFLELSELIKNSVPSAEIIGVKGKPASFEVHVNDELVYSKLEKQLFPDLYAVSLVCKDVSEGKPVRKVDSASIYRCEIV